jgi:hypothetical protein
MVKMNSPSLFETDLVPSVQINLTPGIPISELASMITPIVWEKKEKFKKRRKKKNKRHMSRNFFVN